MKKIKEYIVLKDSVSRDKVWDITGEHYWNFWNEIEESSEKPYELIFTAYHYKNQSPEVIIHYIESNMFASNYFVVEGIDPVKIALILDKIKESLGSEVYTESEIIALIKNSETVLEKCRAIYRLGIIAPSTFNQRIFEVFEQIFADKNPQILSAGIWATCYVNWSELQQKVQELSINSHHDDVRKLASEFLYIYKNVPFDSK